MTGRGDLALALVLAVSAHAGAALLVGGDVTGGDGGGGAAGEQEVTVAAAAPAIANIVREWDRVPELDSVQALRLPDAGSAEPAKVSVDTAPQRVPLPNTPAVAAAAESAPKLLTVPIQPTALPGVSDPPSYLARIEPKTTPSLLSDLSRPESNPPPLLDTAPPSVDFAPQDVASPLARPNREASSAVARKVASGVGGIGGRGDAPLQASRPSTDADKRSATSAWAAEIQQRIARHHVYPRSSRDEGRVRVAMIILPTGKLTGVSIERSSGSESLDRAALDAVKRAAPFPPAPASLNEASYTVGQWITFRRR